MQVKFLLVIITRFFSGEGREEVFLNNESKTSVLKDKALSFNFAFSMDCIFDNPTKKHTEFTLHF